MRSTRIGTKWLEEVIRDYPETKAADDAWELLGKHR